mmetsp:Transcript_9398/g.21195  ORF Transcript_9398/g.21195 Transcript_9398/m.21195 type:complete len:320 (-) Transcript_9398:44-1003(-)|eukprot:CAMPEP_0172317100 /NCGR_PEP_ID=MMETSP1058-20130122/30557_1 /TAXON_ID=83371 /ORGANISM="Detonula confervacea, Strain CCMP 353" /LENGTH=319 /DNA_ID=CAMNT_0013031571 /DNA_START=83 /DNA_END=1045 /DNA_ORIENTATION=-
MVKPSGLFPWVLLTHGVVSAFVTPQQTTTHHVVSSTLRLTPLNMVATAPPQISPSDIQTLSNQGYVIIPKFLPQSLVDELRQDITTLRSNDAFKQAKIGQDSTNDLNTNIRIAETCFLGRSRPELTSIASAGGTNSVRDRSGGMYDILDGLCDSLDNSDPLTRLDKSLSELLYAYYPQGGFYRRHRDAIPNSASVLRKYSLLLYLNKESWDPDPKADAGQLRIHLDGGGDECPPGVEPNYVDVDPLGGTLVLFKSEMVPHEVLATNSERFALVGWYNRGVTAGDIGNLGDAGGGADIARVGMLLVAMGLMTFGVASIIG